MLSKNVQKFAAVAAVALTLSACANTQKDSDTKVDTATEAKQAATSAAQAGAHEHGNAVTLENGYVKAKPAEKSMTGVFGTLHNGTSKPVTLISFSTDTGAGKHEIHEVKDGVMQQKQGGFDIPAGGDLELKPGGNHLMIMDLSKNIAAGDTVKVSLKFADGTVVDDLQLPVRTIASGEESYGAGGGVQGHNGVSEAPAAHEHHHG
ncbi:copper chaperone PCu(A)C [Staphylococcus chromogenes]|nr:copper chaperone PCu(A)C [Staphylococcus chromogenes]